MGVWAVLGILITVGVIIVPQGYAQDRETQCSLVTLNGTYLFDATGFNMVNGAVVPKTVVEFITFKGDGSLTTLGTAVVGGILFIHQAPGTGSYTVKDDCTGTLIFNGSNFTFDLYIAPHGRSFHMIQTVTGQMLAGEARRVAR